MAINNVYWKKKQKNGNELLVNSIAGGNFETPFAIIIMIIMI